MSMGKDQFEAQIAEMKADAVLLSSAFGYWKARGEGLTSEIGEAHLYSLSRLEPDTIGFIDNGVIEAIPIIERPEYLIRMMHKFAVTFAETKSLLDEGVGLLKELSVEADGLVAERDALLDILSEAEGEEIALAPDAAVGGGDAMLDFLKSIFLAPAPEAEPEEEESDEDYWEDAIDDLALKIHEENRKWWIDLDTGEPLDRNRGEMIALMHSELSEALEGVRKNKADDHLPDMTSEEVEMADAVIRILDYAAGFGLRIGEAIRRKRAYNQKRVDHTLEARRAAGGKKF